MVGLNEFPYSPFLIAIVILQFPIVGKGIKLLGTNTGNDYIKNKCEAGTAVVRLTAAKNRVTAPWRLLLETRCLTD